MTEAQWEWAYTCIPYLVMSPWFDRFIISVILLNTACIAVTSFGDREGKTRVVDFVNTVCSVIFIIEAMFRISALGVSYFYRKWNRSLQHLYRQLSVSETGSQVRMGDSRLYSTGMPIRLCLPWHWHITIRVKIYWRLQTKSLWYLVGFAVWFERGKGEYLEKVQHSANETKIPIFRTLNFCSMQWSTL